MGENDRCGEQGREKGSTFWVKFPLSIQTDAMPAPESERVLHVLQGTRQR